jgi:hypothetical protein
MNDALITDWRNVVALAAITAFILAAIAWQRRGNASSAAQWLYAAALPLELLGLALSVFWAVNAPDGAILPFIFVAGWVAMAIGRLALIPVLTSRQAGFWAWVGILLAYLALYSSGLFHAMNTDASAAAQRLETSKPAQALDAEIEVARSRLASLSGYADTQKAAQDSQAAQDEMSAGRSQRQAILSEIAAQEAILSGCPANYITKCIKPANAEIARLKSQLQGIGGVSGAGGYATRHSEYLGVQSHLSALLGQRAEISENGGVQEQWNADDRAIAWLLGISPEQANRAKWLLFTLIFDLVSLAFRVVASALGGGNEAKSRLNALIDAGLTPNEAVNALQRPQSPQQPQQTPQPHPFGFVPAAASLEANIATTQQPQQQQQQQRGFFRSWSEMAQGKVQAQSDNRNAVSQCDKSQSDNRNAVSQCDNRNAVAQSDMKQGLQTLACKHCSTEFKQRTVWQKFCSESCRNAYNGFVPRKRKK